jgi:hypothetical protein
MDEINLVKEISTYIWEKIIFLQSRTKFKRAPYLEIMNYESRRNTGLASRLRKWLEEVLYLFLPLSSTTEVGALPKETGCKG